MSYVGNPCFMVSGHIYCTMLLHTKIYFPHCWLMVFLYSFFLPLVYYLYYDLNVVLFLFNKEKSPEQFSRLVRTLPPLGDGSLKPASGVISNAVVLGVPTPKLPNSEAANTNKNNESAVDDGSGDHLFPLCS